MEPKRGTSNRGNSAGSTDSRFDRWLSWRLHDAYDGVLKEPLPAELTRLVQLLGAQGTDAGEADRQPDDSDPLGPVRRTGALIDGRAPGPTLFCSPPVRE